MSSTARPSFTVNPARLRLVNDARPDPVDGECVVSLMMRSQRATDNLAFDHAVDVANELQLPLVVVLSLGRGPACNNERHVTFMLAAWDELATGVSQRASALVLRSYDAPPLLEVVQRLRPATVITDEDVMPAARITRTRLASELICPMVAVDADVVVPQSTFLKQEYAARTIRPKIHRMLDTCLDETTHDRPAAQQAHPMFVQHLDGAPHVHVLTRRATPADIAATVDTLRADAARQNWDSSADPVDWPSGAAAARARFDSFLRDGLNDYAARRNRPDIDGTSLLSPYLHYGHISALTVAREAADIGGEGAATFVEEHVVRRELAINFVRHNPSPMTINGAPDWAKKSHAEHVTDMRPVLYDWEDFVAADTFDPLWNAAQNQLMRTGHMHGYMRMYWAKKILEWTLDPGMAFDIALELNDVYGLDGRDPGGITGVAWAIAGVHDRAWFSRPVFGKIRSMTLRSTRRKFNSDAYIAQWDGGLG